MRLGELSGKEIINLSKGVKMGILGYCDLLVDETTGKIEYLLIPGGRGRVFPFGEKSYIRVSWESIKKIGPDAVILNIEDHNLEKGI
ncbi:YlmC/YmxH family sporulation protein [Thermosediminibacter oceani]|uniref:Sporulation protein, YlmC/YmxH family n=1 Tax=Thermosediminibacter oceani (strain ATCC BAA-1034 / DSM 16646 / JW/IW-1228P) TaxID=555079 RepID=D9S3K7_THEOJ|nr:YlmC/YmxH family sporulation protein [Thermosediminibacter oceani]ADL07984.1 sporulation protein, YlmC/YmxH family [Thermosediminibacter oceani DSM 16646]